MVLRKSLIYSIIALLTVLFSADISAQDSADLYVYGNVKDYFSRKKLAGVTVRVTQNGSNFDSQSTSSSGKYEFFLKLDFDYTLIFEKSGFVSKRIRIDTRNIPEEDRRGGFSMNPDMSLFEEIENLDFAVLNEPIGLGKYDPTKGNIEFDMAYTGRVQAEIMRLMREVEKANDQEAKADDVAAKEAERLEAEFQKLMSDGKAGLIKKTYQSAVENFQGALSIKPDDPEAKTKLGEAQTKLDEQLAQEEAEQKFNEFIDKGDAAMRAKDWTDAISNFDGALNIKPGENYASDQKKLAEDALAKDKQRLDDEAEVARLISAGDDNLASNEFAPAIKNYEEAIDIIPGHKEASDKLAEVMRLRDGYEAEAAMREKYQALIEDADQLFDGEDYKGSIVKYTSASEVMNAETYPKDRIKEANDRIAQLDAEAQEAAEREARQAEFDELVKKGDSDVTAERFDEGISNYESALQIFADDAEVERKLSDARQAKEDKLAAQEADERYSSLIADADRLFEKEEWEASIETYRAANEAKNDPYPIQRIAEAEEAISERDRLAEEALAAEAERLRVEEEESRAKAEAAAIQEEFDAFIKAGDDDFESETFESAIGNYERALGVIPDNASAKEKLEKAQKALEDSLAQMAEDERRATEDAALAAQQAEFDAFVESGDDDFKEDAFDSAINNYESALGVFPENTETKDKLERAKKAYEDMLAQMADDEKRATEEAALAARQADYETYMALGNENFSAKDFEASILNFEDALTVIPGDRTAEDKLRRAQDANAEYLANLEESAKRAIEDAARAEEEAAERANIDLFNQLIGQGDAAYAGETFEPAIDNYTEALEIYPDDKTAQNKLRKAQDALKGAIARMAENEKLEAEEEARLAQEELERAARDKEEEARSARERSVRDSLDAINAQRMAVESIEKEYNQLIKSADDYFNTKDYSLSREYYVDALGIKSEEVYPQSRIERIDLLLAEIEEAERLRAEREAKKKEEEIDRGFVKGSDLASSEEDNIDARMAEERRRRQQEKWDAMDAEKQKWKDAQADLRRGAGSRQDENEELIASYKETNQGTTDRFNREFKDQAEDMAAYKSGIGDQATRNLSEQNERVSVNLNKGEEVRETKNGYQEKYYERNSTYDTHSDKVASMRKTSEEIAEKGSTEYLDKLEIEADWKSKVQEEESDRRERSDTERDDVNEAIVEIKENIRSESEERSGERMDTNIDLIDRRKEQSKVTTEDLIQRSEDERNANYEEQHDQVTYIGGKEPMDYKQSELAGGYPQGVTEETYTEGKKEVIRRIVVLGNKANEYHKVVSVSGSYYFKNGISISKTLWDLESDKVIE